ncbi:MAG: LysR family transcriptional regulator, partial [Burkholderiales bacterium]|nr:LysR family transcriptional regulator [Burkholderiales bacterium]
LGIEPAKVSRIISGLEKELETELFDKSRRPFKPTEECQRIIPFAREMINKYRDIKQIVTENNSSSLIRVAAPGALFRDRYAASLVAYSESHPSVQFSLLPQAEEEALLSGEADVLMMNHVPEDTSSFVVRPIVTVGAVPLASPKYLSEHGIPKNPSQLKEHSGLLLQQRTSTPTVFLYKNGIPSEIISWKRILISHDQHVLKSLLLAHKGITIDLSLSHVANELEQGKVIPILSGWERPEWNMCIVTRKDQELESETLRTFASWWATIESHESTEIVARCRRMLNRISFAS